MEAKYPKPTASINAGPSMPSIKVHQCRRNILMPIGDSQLFTSLIIYVAAPPQPDSVSTLSPLFAINLDNVRRV